MKPVWITLCVLLLSLAGYCRGQNDTSSCDDQNPIFGCFQSMSAVVTTSNDTRVFCSALEKYVSCVEEVACTCGIANSPTVLEALTYYIGLYKQNGCIQVLNGEFIVEPGVQCPDQNVTGSTIDQGLLVLALDSVPAVITLDAMCPGIRECYKNFSSMAEQALYNKDLDAMCISREHLMPCIEEAVCNCNGTSNSMLINAITTERRHYNTFCSIITGGVEFEPGFQCIDLAPVSVCVAENPISDCYNSYVQAIGNNFNETRILCPAVSTFINCTESVACECGLTTSPPVLSSLSLLIANYDAIGCETVTGKMTVEPGIRCPVGPSFNGTQEVEVLLTLGLLNNPLVMEVINGCSHTMVCYIQVDSSTAAALHNKDASALCRSQSMFIHCMEQAVCNCGKYADEQFNNMLYVEKTQHLARCPNDVSIQEHYNCDFCVRENPLYDCLNSVEMILNSNTTERADWCSAIEQFVTCAENVGCTCMIENSKVVLQSLAHYIHLYDEHICFFLADQPLSADPGVKCPHQNVTGSDEDKALLVLSLETIPEVLNLDRLCSGIKKCYKDFSDGGGTALYNKDLLDFCRVTRVFISCYEATVCTCGRSDASDVLLRINHERDTYNQVCTRVTLKKYSETSISCQDTIDKPVDTCQISNAFNQCQTGLQNAKKTDNKLFRCSGYKSYLTCMETRACQCGLQHSYSVLKALTLIIRSYQEEQCSEESGIIAIASGIPCPAGSPQNGNALDEKLLSLGLLQDSQIQAYIAECPRFEKCYEASDKTTAQALFNKDATAMCKSHSTFVECGIKAVCECGNFKISDSYKQWLQTEINFHLSDCNPDTPIVTTDVCSTGCGMLISAYVLIVQLVTVILYNSL
ncbi:hypothetical protein SNE40_003244 [Patella caerulea]|uniref:Uncharacterized protein n=1 Tax=Patella caerulea TaxID=87958 RepID=A0AAN8Q8E2_PATCE